MSDCQTNIIERQTLYDGNVAFFRKHEKWAFQFQGYRQSSLENLVHIKYFMLTGSAATTTQPPKRKPNNQIFDHHEDNEGSC